MDKIIFKRFLRWNKIIFQRFLRWNKIIFQRFLRWNKIIFQRFFRRRVLSRIFILFLGCGRREMFLAKRGRTSEHTRWTNHTSAWWHPTNHEEASNRGLTNGSCIHLISSICPSFGIFILFHFIPGVVLGCAWNEAS